MNVVVDPYENSSEGLKSKMMGPGAVRITSCRQSSRVSSFASFRKSMFLFRPLYFLALVDRHELDKVTEEAVGVVAPIVVRYIIPPGRV